MLMLDTQPNYIENSEQIVKETTGFFAELASRFLAFLPNLAIAAVVFICGMILAKLISKLVKKAVKRASVEKTASSFGRSLGSILLYAFLIIICLTILGVPMTSIVAVIGAAGLAVGLALQNSLSNLAGGFIILFAKIFSVGDYIIVGDAEGYVESVSILYTRLTARDHRTIYLPNGSVSSGQIINLSQQASIRISVPVFVSYAADFHQTETLLLDAIAKHPMFLDSPAPSVSMRAHANSAVELSLNVWVEPKDYFSAKSELLILTKTTLDAAKIEIPYPQLCLHPSASLPASNPIPKKSAGRKS